MADDYEFLTAQSDLAYAKQEFGLLLDRLRKLPVEQRARLQGIFMEVLMGETVSVETPRGPLKFVALSKRAGGRAVSMLTKQPETIAWIDRFAPDSVFWDVGANVGVYALYAAARDDMRVVAFEPAAVNYFLLAANAEANGFAGRLDCLLVGLGEDTQLAHLEVSQFDAAATFRFPRAAKPKAPRHAGRQAATIMSVDQMIDRYGLPCPNYIKIDVPTLTPAILKGASSTLARPEVREVHIEANEDSSVVETLRPFGFRVADSHLHGNTGDVTLVKA